MIIRDELKEAIPNWEELANQATYFKMDGVVIEDYTAVELSVMYLALYNAVVDAAIHVEKNIGDLTDCAAALKLDKTLYDGPAES